jgi:hypothetical protein
MKIFNFSKLAKVNADLTLFSVQKYLSQKLGTFLVNAPSYFLVGLTRAAIVGQIVQGFRPQLFEYPSRPKHPPIPMNDFSHFYNK